MWQFFAAMTAVTSVMSFMGSMRKMETMQTGAAWDKYHKRIDQSYKTIQANDRARLLISAKRAAQGARGVQIATGSTLIEQDAVVANLEDTLFWIDKGAEMDLRTIDIRLAGYLQKESWERRTSLLTGMGKTYTAYQGASSAKPTTYSISS